MRKQKNWIIRSAASHKICNYSSMKNFPNLSFFISLGFSIHPRASKANSSGLNLEARLLFAKSNLLLSPPNLGVLCTSAPGEVELAVLSRTVRFTAFAYLTFGNCTHIATLGRGTFNYAFANWGCPVMCLLAGGSICSPPALGLAGQSR